MWLNNFLLEVLFFLIPITGGLFILALLVDFLHSKLDPESYEAFWEHMKEKYDLDD